jgi:hypothetical protein
MGNGTSIGRDGRNRGSTPGPLKRLQILDQIMLVLGAQAKLVLGARAKSLHAVVMLGGGIETREPAVMSRPSSVRTARAAAASDSDRQASDRPGKRRADLARSMHRPARLAEERGHEGVIA